MKIRKRTVVITAAVAATIAVTGLLVLTGILLTRPYRTDRKWSEAFAAYSLGGYTRLVELVTQDAEAILRDYPELGKVSYDIDYKDGLHPTTVRHVGACEDSPVLNEAEICEALMEVKLKRNPRDFLYQDVIIYFPDQIIFTENIARKHYPWMQFYVRDEEALPWYDEGDAFPEEYDLYKLCDHWYAIIHHSIKGKDMY